MEFIIVILVIVAILWLLRLFFPFIVLWLLKRQQRNWERQFGQGTPGGNGTRGGFGGAQRQKAKEGEVRVEKMNAEHKKVKENVGEDVEFEDVEEIK